MKGVSLLGKVKSFARPTVIEVDAKGMGQALTDQILSGALGRWGLRVSKRQGGDAAVKKFIKEIRAKAAEHADYTAGTIAPIGNNRVGIYIRRGLPTNTRKAILTHERAHLVPGIGHSEIVAHLAGAGRSLSLGEFGEALNHATMLPRARPGRFMVEVGVGGAGYAGYRQAKKYLKRKEEGRQIG